MGLAVSFALIFLFCAILESGSVSALSEDFSASGKSVVYANKCSASHDRITVFNSGSITSAYSIKISGEAAQWTVAAPASFSLEPGKSQDVYFHMKVPCETPVGSYSLETAITTKIGSSKSLLQEVSVGRISNLAITPVSYSETINPCETAQYKFKVTNVGDFPETYEFSAEPFGNSTSFFPAAAVIAAGKSAEISFSVTPDCSVYGNYGLSVLTHAVTNDLSAKTSGFQLNINRAYDFSMAPGRRYTPEAGKLPEFIESSNSYSLCEQESLHIPVKITNLAGMQNTYTLSLEKDEGIFSRLDWITLSGNKVSLSPGQSAIATISIEPNEIMDRQVEISLVASSALGGIAKKLPINVDIGICHIPLIADGISSIKTTYKPSSVPITIKNTGNTKTNYILSVEGADWIRISPEEILVEPGKEGKLSLSLNPSQSTKEGAYPAKITAKVDGKSLAYSKQVEVKLKSPRFSNMIFDEYLPYTIGAMALLALLIAALVAALIHLEKTKEERRITREERRKIREEKRAERLAEREARRGQRYLAREERRRAKDANREMRRLEKEELRRQRDAWRDEKARLKEEKRAERLKAKEELRMQRDSERESWRKEKEARRQEALKAKEDLRKEKEERKNKYLKEKESLRESRAREKQEKNEKLAEAKEKSSKNKETRKEKKKAAEEKYTEDITGERAEYLRIKAEKRAELFRNIKPWMPLIILVVSIILLAAAAFLVYKFAMGFVRAHLAEIILVGLIVLLLAAAVAVYEIFFGRKCKVFRFEGISESVSARTGWRKGLGEIVANFKIPVANSGLVLRRGGKGSAFIRPEGKEVYQYFEVLKKTISEEDISDVMIRFRVDRAWLRRKNIKESSVKLLRLDNGTWEQIFTEKADSDKKHEYYQSETSSLSLFAIAAKPEPRPIKPKVIYRTVIKIKEVIKKVPVVRIKRIIKEVKVIQIRRIPVVRIKEIIKRVPFIKKQVVIKEVPVVKIKEVPVVQIKEVPVVKIREVVVKPQKRAKRTGKRTSDLWVWAVFAAFVVAMLILAGIFVYKSIPGIRDMISPSGAAVTAENETAAEEPAIEPVEEPVAEEPAEEEEEEPVIEEPAAEEPAEEEEEEPVVEEPVAEEPVEEPAEEEPVAEEPVAEEPAFEEPKWGIQKQEWHKDEAYYLDLNTYFNDPDGDVLTFSHTPLEHITVSVSDGIAEFSPEEGWTGTEIVMFIADDGKGGIVESNDFRLAVSEKPTINLSVIDSVRKNVAAYSTYIMTGVLILIILILLMEFRKPLMKFVGE